MYTSSSTGGVLAVHRVRPGPLVRLLPARPRGHVSPPHPTTSPGNLPIEDIGPDFS